MQPTNPTLLIVVSLIFCAFLSNAQKLDTELVTGEKPWIDPDLRENSSYQSIVVWFDRQLLGSGDSFEKRSSELKGRGRDELISLAITTLKELSDKSFNVAKADLARLQISGNVRKLKQHWIINGFSCEANPEGLKAISKIEGVAKIFQKRPAFLGGANQDRGPEYLEEVPKSRFKIEEVASYPWNIEKIRAPEVWRAYGITGKGTLNVVHDFGFKLDIPPLAESIYVNSDEIPGNGIDDDRNGFVDDFHGFNFDANNPSVNNPGIRRGTIIHGNACAAMISGTFETETNHAIGIAPDSKWAPVIGSANIEQAVEWAIEQGADTYSMSFSQPNLGEFKSHWRKVLEHANFCGVVFISGAGNFAAGNNKAPIPVQMRNPEDIPHAVLGVAGVGEDGTRPVFSSQGPVAWSTEHYTEGRVSKPDFATFNFQISCVDFDGKLSNQASGNSFAGPHMAGIVSLMLSANPDLMPWDVKDILIETAEDIGKEGFDYQSGHGFVNAYDAVTEALKRKN